MHGTGRPGLRRSLQQRQGHGLHGGKQPPAPVAAPAGVLHGGTLPAHRHDFNAGLLIASELGGE